MHTVIYCPDGYCRPGHCCSTNSRKLESLCHVKAAAVLVLPLTAILRISTEPWDLLSQGRVWFGLCSPRALRLAEVDPFWGDGGLAPFACGCTARALGSCCATCSWRLRTIYSACLWLSADSVLPSMYGQGACCTVQCLE